LTGPQEQDVFTLAAAEIKQLRLLNEDKFRHLQGYCKAASIDKRRIQLLHDATIILRNDSIGREEATRLIDEAERLAEISEDHADVTKSLAYRVLNAHHEQLKKEHQEALALLQAAESELDPPVCRLQFPDGTVPGNAREAAEGWKRWYDEMDDEANYMRGA